MMNKNDSLKNLPSLIFVSISIILMTAESIIQFTSYYPGLIKPLLLISLLFDILFLIEFVIRLVISLIKGTFLEYIFLRSGWIDLFVPASVLLLFSAPLLLKELGIDLPFFPLTENIGSISLIRLVRFLKLTGNNSGLHNQTMKRSLSSVSTTAVIACLTVIFSYTLLTDWNLIPSLRKNTDQSNQSTVNTLIKLYGLLPNDEFARILGKTASTFPDIAMIDFDKKNLYSTGNPNYLFTRTDLSNPAYQMKSAIGGRLRILFNREDLLLMEAVQRIFYIILITGIVLFIHLFYRRHLSISLIQPIKRMVRGFEETYAVDPVPVNTFYHDDEIARLIISFNNRWMKAKLRKIKEIENRR